MKILLRRKKKEKKSTVIRTIKHNFLKKIMKNRQNCPTKIVYSIYK